MAAPVVLERHPFGSVLEYSADDSSYTAISEKARIKLPDMERSKTNVTKIDSTEMWKEYIESWKEPGVLEFDLYFTETQYSTLLGTHFATLPGRTLYYWRYTGPLISTQTTGFRMKYVGFLMSIKWSEIKESDDGALMIPCSVQCTGKPTFTVGS